MEESHESSSRSEGVSNKGEPSNECTESLKGMRSIVDNFLKQNVKQGLLISDGAIQSAIKRIDESLNDANIYSSLPIEYIHFLSEYGSIFGKGYEICGPTGDNSTTDEKKSAYILYTI